MPALSTLKYRLYLFRKALAEPSYTIPAGLAAAASLLSYQVDPNLPLFGAVATLMAMYIALDAAVLRFPADLRPRFHAWFAKYQDLRKLNPEDSGIDLSGSSVDPDFILSLLRQMTNEELGAPMFQKFAQDVDNAFTTAERGIIAARATRDTVRLQRICREIEEETQRIRGSVDAYEGAMTSVYGGGNAVPPDVHDASHSPSELQGSNPSRGQDRSPHRRIAPSSEDENQQHIQTPRD